MDVLLYLPQYTYFHELLTMPFLAGHCEDGDHHSSETQDVSVSLPCTAATGPYE
jgi:hypothetical protein